MSAAPSRSRAPRPRARLAAALALALAGVGCQSSASELSSLSQRPPLDYAVLLTGGAFLQRQAAGDGTFDQGVAVVEGAPDGAGGDLPLEPIGIDEVLSVLRQGAVFQRVDVDANLAHRLEVLRKLQGRGADRELLEFLQSTRDRGYDLVLAVEQLQDNPIDAQGVNARWPVTLATWLLLGVGAFIPDHTFESGATLRATLRDLQTGAVVFDSLSSAGPVDLSLVERSSTLGLLLSLVVPPFWVHDDTDSVRAGVRDVTRRRLLLSLARELKSEPTRQRLRERAVATITLAEGRRLLIDAAESLSAVRLRSAAAGPDPLVLQQWERDLLATLRRDGERFEYRSELPPVLWGSRVQVLVSTISGRVTSATFGAEGAR